jgi:Aspartyl protease/PDZ domain
MRPSAAPWVVVLLSVTAVAAERSSARCIPFDPANHQISLKARINGQHDAWLVLDTGASGSVLDEARARAMGIREVGRQESHGAGGMQAGGVVDGVDVQLPGFQLFDQTMDTLSLASLSAQAGRPFDGILGHPVFERSVVEVDYPRRCLSLHDAAEYRYTGQGSIVPIEFIENHPYVRARAVLPDGRAIDGRFVIDSGSSTGLILSPGPAERERVLGALGKTLAVQAQGVGGANEVRVSRLARLELGGFALERPILVLQPAGSGRVSAPGTIGNIGGAILNRFKVIFDYRRKRMILEPGPDWKHPFESDKTGLGIVASLPDYERVTVAAVLEDSPAKDAGIAVGDEIESVNGTPVAEIGVPTLRERFRRGGAVVELGLRRGTRRITATLRTRALI